VTRHHSCRVSPFGHPRIHARLTAPRGITQPPTSFIGSQCQGIHHAPLNTYNTKPKVIQNFEIAHQHTRKHQPPKRAGATCVPDARNHYPQIKHHTPPPKQGNNQTHPQKGRYHPRFPQLQGEEVTGLLSQSPIVCLAIPRRPTPSDEDVPGAGMLVVHQNHTHYRCGPSIESPSNPEPPHNVGGPESRGAP
jgi:hypothetical protein